MTRRMCYLVAFYINLSTIHFFEVFVKWLNSAKKMTPGKRPKENKIGRGVGLNIFTPKHVVDNPAVLNSWPQQ